MKIKRCFFIRWDERDWDEIKEQNTRFKWKVLVKELKKKR